MTAHTIISSLLLLVCLPEFIFAANATTGGKAKYRILGGVEVKGSEYPFVVHLLGGELSCTGMIISEEWVLTAAHCLPSAGVVIRVYAGGTDYLVESENTQVINATKTIAHEDYVDGELKGKFDIALIQVEKPFDLSKCCVKKGTLVTGKFPEVIGGLTCTVLGFGSTTASDDDTNHLLHKLSVQATVLVECWRTSYYINDIFGLHPFAFPESSGQRVCVDGGKVGSTMGILDPMRRPYLGVIRLSARWRSSGHSKNICPGDSGGPLVCNGLLVGVASMYRTKVGGRSLGKDEEATCAEKYSIGVYGFIGYHIQWIKDRVPNIIEPRSL